MSREFKFVVCLTTITFACLFGTSSIPADEFPRVFNTQDPGEGLTTPQDALRGITVPDGFRVSLFAAEPDVQQPIAMAMDERGRLWVAENYTYAERKANYETRLRDRIIILEDTDSDGQFDKRKVFWDQASKLTSIEIGFGGVWALCAPNLLFIPDKNRDDVPDREPIVLIDGFDGDSIRHNIVNGLRWGPDGWLYGRHGITTTSFIGSPDTPKHERIKMNCGIWRFHPTRQVLEVVARGTTNPWGMDWDDHGQMFFINTVIGHLWHVIPGAYYERMFSEHFNPHLYKYIPQTADHFHWDTQERWSDIRKLGVTTTTDEAGGGHAHCGMMIYLGDNWPKKYRGTLFTANLHGRRINNERLDREGASYVGKHAPDFLTVKDPWFRGIELCYGPDGGVYIADWSDIGECHENDGIHRTSGRIYKVTFGKTEAVDSFDLSKLKDASLVQLQLNKNDWYVRRARRLLQERATNCVIKGDSHTKLFELFDQQDDVTRKLRAMWCLHVIDKLDEKWLLKQLKSEEEHIRVWAIKLLVDEAAPSPKVRGDLLELAKRERSGLVLCFLASAINRFPTEERLTLGRAISQHDEFADDRVLPLMVWYGIEPAVVHDAKQAIELADTSRMPILRRYVARRLTAEIERQPEGVRDLVALLNDKRSVEYQLDVLEGMSAALQGWRQAPMPANWKGVKSVLTKSSNDRVGQLQREISLVFGDGRAEEELLKIAASGANLASRRAAIRTLVASRIKGLVPTLQKLLDNRDLAADAVRGLAAYDDPGTPKLLVDRINRMRTVGREEAINVLVSRPSYAKPLLDAVADGRIDRNRVSAFQLRQMQTFGDQQINAHVAKLWPELKQISADKIAKIHSYSKSLSPERLSAADLSAGRTLFHKSCANCHKLFGQGGQIGPDLTGAQRSNLQYLLENIVDPSATVSKNFHMSILQLADGRVLNGIVLRTTERTLTLQTQKERLILAQDEIEDIRKSQLSMMPERLLDVLTDNNVRDLIGYLMSPKQVPIP